ncbi:MAG: TIGR00266 family protein [Anaerolineales bacterium]|nr:TIGR00266 family protein [Anaerolineales bacterium]MCX7755380.1 TIGR00266 family protein [Anaerolineales bacterium]MDW8278568.1 TIGR00266 family protein [Anaerolineales bacterium]
MQIEIQHRPSYSLAIVQLAPNERIRAESGAMVSMSAGVNIETQAAGGFLKSFTRAVLGGESFFQNFFQAGPQGGEVTLAPDLPGDIALIELRGETMMVQAGSYLASESGIELSTKVSMKAFLSAEGLSMLEATGSGKLLVSSYGAIFERVLAAGEKYIVDTSHLVAFDATVQVAPRTAGGMKTTLFSGEGLVVELTGPGRLYIQTRSPQALINWIIPQLPKSGSDS